jgi:hypothetical protein
VGPASGSYIPDVRTVGLEVLQNELSEYVRLASEGERVVAELVPPAPPGRAERGADAVLAGLVREGLVTPALMQGRPLRVEHARGAKLTELVAELDMDRGDR